MVTSPSERSHMPWVHERYPFLMAKIVELAPTSHRTQKGCGGDLLHTRQIKSVKTFRKGQYGHSGMCPSGRGSSISVKRVAA